MFFFLNLYIIHLQSHTQHEIHISNTKSLGEDRCWRRIWPGGAGRGLESQDPGHRQGGTSRLKRRCWLMVDPFMFNVNTNLWVPDFFKEVIYIYIMLYIYNIWRTSRIFDLWLFFWLIWHGEYNSNFTRVYLLCIKSKWQWSNVSNHPYLIGFNYGEDNELVNEWVWITTYRNTMTQRITYYSTPQL